MTESAASLAQRSSYTAEQWQDALNALGPHATELLPTVEHYAARQGLIPLAAAVVVLETVGESRADR